MIAKRFVMIMLLVVSARSILALSPGEVTVLSPRADGTLVDGGVYGTYDGVADRADWYFNNSTFENSIMRSTERPQSSVEYRVFWEYDLSGVAAGPVRATLAFGLRGATVSSAPDAVVYVFAYPADLRETFSDFSSGPVTYQGSATIAPFEGPSLFSIDVSRAVTQALLDSNGSIGFRFLIDPNSIYPASQAFTTANEDEPSSKPSLTIEPTTIGDQNGNGVVDLDDYSGFTACMTGPTMTTDDPCLIFDFDQDQDVDFLDFDSFQWYFNHFGG